MLKNYLSVLVRNLQKNPVYSFINISGLAIGITCSLLILLWVFDELSYDRFHPKSDRLYQVWINAWYDGKISSWTSVPLPTYQAFKTVDPHIKNTVVTDWGGTRLMTAGEKRMNKKSYYVGEEFLTMFEFPMIAGNPAKALSDPGSIVLTESTAKALFGEADPMNQLIQIDNKDMQKVTGVVKDVPGNSTFQFDFLLPWKLNETREWIKRDQTNWGNYSFQVFVELDNPSSEQPVEASIENVLEKNGQTDVKRIFWLHPMTRWRLYSNIENGKESGGMIDYVKLFTIIAVFILVIACINFMNLATARSERRAREVGIRKSVGSRRREIIFQFLGESLIITTLAAGVALLLAEGMLPFYNELVQKQLRIDLTAPAFWLFIGGLVFLTGILSGSYPAFYLSSFSPVKVLKGKIQVGRNASLPRKVLVTLQFGFSILLMIGTMVVYKQIQYVQSRQLGYNQQNLITVDYTDQIEKNYSIIKKELVRTGVVASVTKSNSPVTDIWSNNFLGWPGKPKDQKVMFATIATEYDYTRTMGIKVLEGRDFSEEFKSDSNAILVNKAAADLMQLKNPLGTQLDVWDDPKAKRTLIGIVDNVLMGSPFRAVGPAFYIYEPNWISSVTIRLEPSQDLKASLSKVEEVFKTYNSAYPFEFTFVDQQFAKKFTTIRMTGELANVFAFLAILVTGLGLFGLAAFTAEQRTKEIGIRKVMGASVTSLIALMSSDFSRMVILAFGITAPLSWWLLNSYLERYPYRIDIPWWVFPLTGIIALSFALLIVSTQALRAARANPAQSLRTE